MGRHTAPDGDTVHPVVAAALARRATDGAGAHRGTALAYRDEPPSRHDQVWERFATQRIRGNLGWPGEPPGPGDGSGDGSGEGLGWPGEPAADADTGTDLSADAEDHPAGQPDGHEPGRRRGWRRLLGLDPAA